MSNYKEYEKQGFNGTVKFRFTGFFDGIKRFINLNDIVPILWKATESQHIEETQAGFELINKAAYEDVLVLGGWINPKGSNHNAFIEIVTWSSSTGSTGGWNYSGKLDHDGTTTTYDGLGTTTYYDTFPKFIYIYGGEDNSVIEFNANIPIFETEEDYEEFVRSGDLTGCLNLDDEFSEETQDYYIYQRWSAATAKNGEVTRTGESTGFYERILANGPICLKKTGEPNAYTIVGAGIVGSAFSSINQYSVEQIQKKNFTDGLLQSGPVYDRYRNSYGDGNFIVGFGDLNSGAITNIPMFSDPEKADDYIDGNVPIEDADNYSYISGGVGVEGNPTGEPEEVTTLSRNLSRGVFAADYTMSRSGLVSLATDFFSSNFWDDIKDGLKYYNNNYMSAVSSCIYFPFDISSVFDLVAVNYVGFGSYQHDVTGYGISRVAFNKGVKDLGETFIRPTFNNFLDFAAVEIYLFLPYIGFVQLQTDKYMGKTLKIQYSIDIHSGECSAMLFANGTLMDTYDGQIGIVNPITSEDLAGYAQAQISGIKTALGSVAGGGISGAMAGAKGGAYGAVAGAIVGSGLGAVNAGLTAYGLMNMKPQLFSSGGYSGALGANLPQYAFLVFAIHETEEPANLIQTHGKPSNRSGLIGDFSGFLSVNSVNLNCGAATEAERAEILQLLYSGIII